jgi:alkylated DNA repair dioxygenase AlkB
MTQDLFGADPVLSRLPLPDADVLHLGHLALPLSYEILLQRLIDETPWRCDEIKVWGKIHLQPRLTAWYADPGRRYTYSGITMSPLPWTPLLQAIREAVEHASGHAFNSVLLNYYRNERDSMGFHSDDEPELGPQPVIASLSLGATRDFVFKHRHRKDLKPYRVPLESGSLLLMRGDTQRNWSHGIEKMRRPLGPRVNLTFRTVV